MTAIDVKVCGRYLNQICMTNQDGNQVEVTKLYTRGGEFESRQIPENHVIVGVYVEMDNFAITSLGFIVMDNSTVK